MSVTTFDSLCAPTSEVTNPNLVEQVSSLEDLAHRKIDGDAFFARNHFTEGMRRLVDTGFDRLAGKSDTGAYYLTQAMGGGKTHTLIAFGLLAADPALRRRVLPEVEAGKAFGAARVVMFNGHQTPNNFLWGFIAEQLGRVETMSPFWANGPQCPGIDDWIAAIGKDQPTLILLDELPSYLQMAQGRTAGSTTLGDLTIGALERLFNALPQLPKCCVVVTNLKDDVYLDGSGQLKTLIDSLTKHYDRNAVAITPVQQNTAEVFEIVRKRLFEKLPGPAAIEAVAQAYVAALDQAKRVDTIPSTPEIFLQRIRETYPFHPSIRDIVGRFSENRGYQKTRALIRLLRHATRGALAAKGQVFLIGLQHLDLNDQATLEEIRKINPAFTNAIAKDIADRGNALAEKIDAMDGGVLAGAVAKTLLLASLSSAENPVRGLREGELYEALVDPLVKVSDLKGALEKYSAQAWYLQKDVQERIYVSQTANVTAEINEIAANIAEEMVDDTLRGKLREVFRPRIGDVYDAEMAVLPALDEIVVSDDRVRLVILEYAADKLPESFDAWWREQERQNAVLLLTVDPNAVKSMRALARRMRAIDRVTETVRGRERAGSAQMREIETIRDKDALQFSSAVREGFKTLIYPIKDRLRSFTDFRMEFQGNDYDGEGQIRKTLAERGKFIGSDAFDAQFENLRHDAEEMLFDADAVALSSLKRNAALRPGWYWLPRSGLEALVKLATQRGYWRERDGLVHKRFEIVTSVTATIDEYGPNPIETGSYLLNVMAQDADTIYFSEKEPPDPARSARLSGRVHQTEAAAVWFLAVDSKGKAKTGSVCEWRAPIRVRAEVIVGAEGKRLSVLAVPRAATVRATFDDSSPAQGSPVAGDVAIPGETTTIRVIGELDGVFGEERAIAVNPGAAEPTRSRPKLDDNAPAVLTSPFQGKGAAQAWSAIALLRDLPATRIDGGSLRLQGSASEGAYVTLRFGSGMPMSGIQLSALAGQLAEQIAFAEPEVDLRLDAVAFASGRDLKRFSDACELDFERIEWEQKA